jgi:hypothetical protein
VSEVVLGEITTRLLMVSEALPAESARSMIAALVPGSHPERAGHPVERVASANLPINVDCHLPVRTGARVPVTGVVAAHAVLTGGHVLQGSAFARVVRGEGTARRRWSHYNSRPGYIELYRAATPEDLVASFLATPTDPALLDLGGAGRQMIDLVHREPVLDRRVRLRTRPLSLRWTARVSPLAGHPLMEFTRFPDGSFQIDAESGPDHLPVLARFCEDVALHTWLLSTMTWSFERAAMEDDKLDELGPALEYLGHLWSPGQDSGEGLEDLWELVESRLHLSRGWQSQVTRVRDQIALLTLRMLQEKAVADRERQEKAALNRRDW